MDVAAAAEGSSSVFLFLFRRLLLSPLPPPPLRSSRGTDLIPRWDSDSAAAAIAVAVFPSSAPAAAPARDWEDPQVGAAGPVFQGILTTTLYASLEQFSRKLNFTPIFLLNFHKFQKFQQGD